MVNAILYPNLKESSTFVTFKRETGIQYKYHFSFLFCGNVICICICLTPTFVFIIYISILNYFIIYRCMRMHTGLVHYVQCMLILFVDSICIVWTTGGYIRIAPLLILLKNKKIGHLYIERNVSRFNYRCNTSFQRSWANPKKSDRSDNYSFVLLNIIMHSICMYITEG